MTSSNLAEFEDLSVKIDLGTQGSGALNLNPFSLVNWNSMHVLYRSAEMVRSIYTLMEHLGQAKFHDP